MELGCVGYPVIAPGRQWLCPDCSSRMLLRSIETDKPGHDRRTFECIGCGHQEYVVLKYKDSFLGDEASARNP